jgi:uncharacterized protein (UPF0303 family)
MASPLPYTVYRVERDRGNTYEVNYYNYEGNREAFSVVAKDELDAFNLGQQAVNKKRANMKTFIICVTLAFVSLLTSAVAGCKISDDTYAANMATCLKAGKSYVKENSGYSCRDIIVRRKTDG